MKHVDLILKYLSGALTDVEKKSFEEDLDKNKDLQSEFIQLKKINSKLGELLRVEQIENETREDFLRNLVIEHDLEHFGGPPETVDELNFISKLKHIENKANEDQNTRNRRFFKSPLFFIAVAASISLLVLITLPDYKPEKIYARYYQPLNDKTLLHFKETMRGDTQIGITLYYKGLYEQSKDHFYPYIAEGASDSYIRLFYALSCFQTDCPDDLFQLLKQDLTRMNDDIEITIAWYYSLYLIHEGDTNQAKAILEKLHKKENPYQRKAGRILKKID